VQQYERTCSVNEEPKLVQQSEKASSKNKEPGAHSISPLFPLAGAENPNSSTPHSVSRAPELASLHINPSVHSNSSEDNHTEEDMANFAVDPMPFIPDGLEVED
jgi:hypothetical protein